MKKIIVLLLLILTYNARSQQKPIRFGLKAGLNVSTLYKTGSETKPAAGYHGGIFIDVPVFRNFRLQPEIVISYQGTGYDINYGTGTMLQDINRTKLYYVNVPVLVKFETPANGMSILAGPQFGKLLSAHESGYYNNFLGGTTENDVESDFRYEDYDFSACAGLEYAFEFGLAIGARGNFGLTNISTQRRKMHNRVAQLYLAYNFL